MFSKLLAGSTVALSLGAAHAGLLQFAGVNIAGFDFGCTIDGTCNLTANYGPTGGDRPDGPAQMKHFTGTSNFNIYRLPVAWQFLLNDKVDGELDATNFAEYDKLMQGCLATGSSCVIDIHNYARWDGKIIGQGGPTDEQFAHVWELLATKYAKKDKVIFGLMNEPHEVDIDKWKVSVQAAVTAIRKAGATTQMILLPGNDFTSAKAFVDNGSADALSKVRDADGSTTLLIFDVHKYLDSDNSGTHAECVTDAIEDTWEPLAAYLRQANRKAILSEFGGGSSEPTCLGKLCAALGNLLKNSDVYLGYIGWAAGSFDTTYILSLTPKGDAASGFTDQPLLTDCFALQWGVSNGSTGSTNGTATSPPIIPTTSVPFGNSTAIIPTMTVPPTSEVITDPVTTIELPTEATSLPATTEIITDPVSTIELSTDVSGSMTAPMTSIDLPSALSPMPTESVYSQWRRQESSISVPTLAPTDTPSGLPTSFPSLSNGGPGGPSRTRTRSRSTRTFGSSFPSLPPFPTGGTVLPSGPLPTGGFPSISFSGNGPTAGLPSVSFPSNAPTDSIPPVPTLSSDSSIPAIPSETGLKRRQDSSVTEVSTYLPTLSPSSDPTIFSPSLPSETPTGLPSFTIGGPSRTRTRRTRTRTLGPWPTGGGGLPPFPTGGFPSLPPGNGPTAPFPPQPTFSAPSSGNLPPIPNPTGGIQKRQISSVVPSDSGISSQPPFPTGSGVPSGIPFPTGTVGVSQTDLPPLPTDTALPPLPSQTDGAPLPPSGGPDPSATSVPTGNTGEPGAGGPPGGASPTDASGGSGGLPGGSFPSAPAGGSGCGGGGQGGFPWGGGQGVWPGASPTGATGPVPTDGGAGGFPGGSGTGTPPVVSGGGAVPSGGPGVPSGFSTVVVPSVVPTGA